MAKSKRKKRKSFVPPPSEPETKKNVASSLDAPPRRWGLLALFFTIAIGGPYLAMWMRPQIGIPECGYKVVAEYPHDGSAFTQGLLVKDGFVYESTGLLKESTLRKVDFETGEVVQTHKLKDNEFGEGLTYLNGSFYQLTWQNKIGYVYDENFNQTGTFEYDHEGWGIATDGTHLIISDGTARLRFLDPKTFEEKKVLFVKRADRKLIGQLNELEFFGSKIYANRYNKDEIYRINSETGEVEAIVNLKGLWPVSERPRRSGQAVPLNGIAVNPKTNKMLVTGKLCPKIFEIDIFPK